MCNHKDGWIMERVVIDADTQYSNDNNKVICKCNHLGCNDTKTFIVDIDIVKEVN